MGEDLVRTIVRLDHVEKELLQLMQKYDLCAPKDTISRIEVKVDDLKKLVDLLNNELAERKKSRSFWLTTLGLFIAFLGAADGINHFWIWLNNNML